MTLLLFYVGTRKKIQSNKMQRISFCPQRWDIPYRNHQACCEKLWFVRSISPNLPQMGQIFYHGMLMLLHDSMPNFMNLKQVLDFLQFKNQASQRFSGNQRCTSVQHGTQKFTQTDTSDFSTNFGALEHVLVGQI